MAVSASQRSSIVIDWFGFVLLVGGNDELECPLIGWRDSARNVDRLPACWRHHFRLQGDVWSDIAK